MSLDCGPGPLSCADWNLSNSLFVAVAARSDVTVWDLSKMSPISKTFLRQVFYTFTLNEIRALYVCSGICVTGNFW